MAQSLLTTPSSKGKHTPTRDLVNDLDYMDEPVEISAPEEGQFTDIESDNANEGTKDANKGTKDANKGKNSAIKGNKDGKDRFAINKNHDRDESDFLSDNDPEGASRDWFTDRSRQRVPETGGKRKRGEPDDVNSGSSDEDFESDGEISSDGGTSDDSNLFDPSELLKKGTKIPTKITKYLEKYANQGISKNVRLEITKNCNIPRSEKLGSKETDRFMKKLFRKKFNSPLSMKKERTMINTENRILDASGPLSILWAEAEKAKSRKRGLNPDDVIDIVQRSLVLLGNAHYVYLSDRRKSLLGRLLPECLDLLDDQEGKRALLKSSHELYGRKFRKLLTEESKDNKELFSLLQAVRCTKHKVNRSNFSNTNGNNAGDGRGRGNQNQFFRLEPPNNQVQFGGRGRGRGHKGTGNRRQGKM